MGFIKEWLRPLCRLKRPKIYHQCKPRRAMAFSLKADRLNTPKRVAVGFESH